MHLTHLRIQSVRSHDAYEMEFSPQTTLITGKNGAGKTTLLESIYIALQGKSFRGVDTEILGRDKLWYRIDLTENGDEQRTVKFIPAQRSGRKQFVIRGKTHYRLPAPLRYPVVLFEPDDLRLLTGSPARRRDFINHSISQVDPRYHTALLRYERALKQRNNLLKQSRASYDELFVWNVALSEYGAYIIHERTLFIEKLNQKIEQRYRAIAGTDDTLSIHYSHTRISDIKQKLLNELIANSRKDQLLGYTTVGPHRHDLSFLFNDKPADQTASRGEIRTTILALKFIEAELIEELTSNPPILLFDDVFSELDETRQDRLANQTDYQIIITTTSAHQWRGMNINLSAN